jgi:hypothetical protein
MNYFDHCQSVEEAKKRYRELLMQYHSDHAGPEGEAITKEIIGQFNALLNSFMSHSFNAYYEDKEWKPGAEAVTPFQDILKKIIDLDWKAGHGPASIINFLSNEGPGRVLHCEIEIIGYWIYCFKSYEVHEHLKDLGFWFSSKHKAWVYSGRAKRLGAGKETLDEIRARKGSQKVEKEEQEKNNTAKLAV